MTPLTPGERVVVFPEPLRDRKHRLRVAAVVVLGVAMLSAGWLLLHDPVVRAVANSRGGPTPPRINKPMPSAVDSGVDAFADASYDSSAAILRRAIAAHGADSLNATQRARALSFLGAAELERGRRDSSAAAFRQLLVLNPNRPPDPDVFPAKVTEFYEELRSKQQGVARIASTADGVALTIVALSPHEVSIGIGQGGQAPLFQLFSGAVSDSVVVKWNGLTPDGAPLKPGTYELVLVAFPSDGTKRRSVRFPVLLERENATGQLHARAPGAPGASAPADRSGRDASHLLS